MSDEYFEALSARSINFDSEVRELTEIWREPHQILSGYGADKKQGEAILQKLKSEITKLKNDIVNDTRATADHIAEMDTFMDDSERQIEELLESCNDIDSVLEEYGYVPPKQGSTPNKSANSSLIPSDVMDNHLEVEFTPDMTWRQKPRANTLSGNGAPDPNLVSKLDKLFVHSIPQE